MARDDANTVRRGTQIARRMLEDADWTSRVEQLKLWEDQNIDTSAHVLNRGIYVI